VHSANRLGEKVQAQDVMKKNHVAYKQETIFIRIHFNNIQRKCSFPSSLHKPQN